MKTAANLKNPDVVEINGEKYQVLEGVRPNSLLYHKDKDDMEWGVDLVKLGSKSITAAYQLRYFSKQPDEVKFFKLGNKDIEIPIKTIRL